ncbi:MAG: hypothetical protein ACOYOO_14175, partial [Saprospiraceae bacterium]
SLLPPAAAEFSLERRIIFAISRSEIAKMMRLSNSNLVRSAETKLPHPGGSAEKHPHCNLSPSHTKQKSRRVKDRKRFGFHQQPFYYPVFHLIRIKSTDACTDFHATCRRPNDRPFRNTSCIKDLLRWNAHGLKMALFRPHCVFFRSRSMAMLPQKAFAWTKNSSFFPPR